MWFLTLSEIGDLVSKKQIGAPDSWRFVFEGFGSFEVVRYGSDGLLYVLEYVDGRSSSGSAVAHYVAESRGGAFRPDLNYEGKGCNSYWVVPHRVFGLDEDVKLVSMERAYRVLYSVLEYHRSLHVTKELDKVIYQLRMRYGIKYGKVLA